ncbi:hypothetical protein ACK399_03880 [Aeromonas veronii]|uniref:Uncharacterized protein n=1 Tax=Aeromonas hydrophila TaxID=644 RepID=A0AAX3PAM0_AERHY|nr:MULTISPECIES: hypothetical protein [Aeromonas]WEE27208.1 hypothetical protein PY771_02525 [Aeromonas hydrophila]
MKQPASGQASRFFVYAFFILVTPDTIYANWDMLIGIDEQGKSQYWRGLAGIEKPENRAVFYNIYEVRGLYLGGNTTKQGLDQGAAQ